MAVLLAFALALSGLFALPMRSYAAGTIVYVDAGASGTGDGSSWADAYPSLADALAGAAAGTEIWVAGGTYTPTSGMDRTATFQLKDDVAIYGGFAGNETQLGERDWQINVTTLSGDLNGDDSGAVSRPDPTREDNSYSVVAGATGATLDGVTITGGYANDSSGSLPKFGGGMYNDNSSPTLANVIISGNFGGNGGGMYNNNSSPTLADVAINGNVSYVGGGMVNQNSNLTLTNVTISGNTAPNGGGMYNINGSNPQVRNSILWSNGSSNVSNSSSTPVFSASIVQGAGGSGAPWSPSFGTDGGGNLDVDPLFVTPVPAPAPTTGGDLHLGPGSPAANAGNNSFLPAGLTTDLDGNPRIVGGSVDMGAYEALDTTPPDTTIDSMPANSTSSTDAAFSFSGSDNMTPAANLTFECALDGASFASCTSPSSYSNLAAGAHTFDVRATDGAGNVDPTPASYSWTVVSEAPTTLLYNGGQIVNVGSNFTLAALLSSSAPTCAASQVVSFALDANPLTGTAGAYALGTAMTNSSGQATMPAVNTTGWLEGVYTINASFAGTSGCLPSSDSATLTVASPGAAANGGGWYTLSGSGRSNFGFTVRKVDSKCTSNCAYKGQLLLINNGKWRVKGNLTTYSKTSTGQGAASGTGDLYWWDASLNGGLGDWALAQSGVSYTINFYDSGKSSTDKYGIRIVYTPVAPQPSALPNSTPQLLKGGDIKVS